MAGLVQSQQNISISDPMLQKIVDGVRAKIPPNLQTAYMQVLTAGKKVMYSPQTSKLMMKRIKMPGDIFHNVTLGITNLIALISNESKGQMSLPAAVLASTELMCDMLDVAEKTIGTKMTPELVANCTHATTMSILQRFGIDQNKINQVIKQGKAGQSGAPTQPSGLVNSQPQVGA